MEINNIASSIQINAKNCFHFSKISMVAAPSEAVFFHTYMCDGKAMCIKFA